MNCPQCQASNPEGAKFCINCGNALPLVCPVCGTQNPSHANYCLNCGTKLASSGTVLSSVAQARPEIAHSQQQEEKKQNSTIEPPENPPGSERRVVTIVFCDVKSSTELAERLDPEEWADVMNQAFRYLIDPVKQYGGTVARLMGDAVLAFFGAPLAHEDDPQRAVLAGLQILEGVQGFRNEHPNLDFNVRVGIHTGLVVVGEVGSAATKEYTAMGDAVNVAARMEQTAQPGSVQISEDVYKLVAAQFEVEALGEIAVKGKGKPIRAYQVLGPRPTETWRRGGHRLRAPLIGRQAEIEVLRQSIKEVRQGRGQVVMLIGEAGLGKSRMIDELHAEWDASEGQSGVDMHTWWESYGLSYEAPKPYAAFQQLIQSVCQPALNGAPVLGCECLPPGMPEQDCVRIRRVYDSLIGAENGATLLQGEAYKQELFSAMRFTWKAWAQQKPVVLAFDDLHWADAASVELLVHLFALVDEVPILFLCCLRPDRTCPAWGIKSALETDYPHREHILNLQPLSMEESTKLVDSLLPENDIPISVQAEILEKGEGNPFFVEEILRSLIESRAVVAEEDPEQGRRWKLAAPIDSLTLPEGVHSLLRARIDRLDEGSRQLLQMASAIGRSFSFQLLSALHGNRVDLQQYLKKLEKVELIYESRRSPELEYSFRHALTHETVYQSILLKTRQFYHLKIAEAIERLYSDRIQENYASLAHHYEQARDQRAVGYYLLAGEQAVRMNANAEAILYLNRAKALLDPVKPDVEQVKRIYAKLGRALEVTGQNPKAMDLYVELEQLAARLGEDRLKVVASSRQATLRALPSSLHDREEAYRLVQESLVLARQLGDQAEEARLLWTILLASIRGGNPHDGLEPGLQALELARKCHLRDLEGYILNDLCDAFLSVHRFQEARDLLQEARFVFEETGNLPMLANCLSSMVLSHFLFGDYDEAIRAQEEAFQIAQKLGNLWGEAYATMYIWQVLYERGEISRAVEKMEECLKLAKASDFLAPQGWIGSSLGITYAAFGQLAQGEEMIQNAYDLAVTNSMTWSTYPLADLIKLALLKGDLTEAEGLIEQALKTIDIADILGFVSYSIKSSQVQVLLQRGDFVEAIRIMDELLEYKKFGLRTYVPDVSFTKGEAFVLSGDRDTGIALMKEAAQEMARLGSRRILWKVYLRLGDLSAQVDDHEAAVQYRQLASTEIAYLADQIDRPEWREYFLNQPEVRRLQEAV